MKQIDLREGARRQHRVVSMFCVIQCWREGVDSLIVERELLERLLGIQRFKETRVQWIKEDFGEFFPHQKTDYDWWPAVTFKKLYLSRVPFTDKPKTKWLKMWKTPDQKHLSDVYEGFIPFFADYANYDERLLSSYLSLLSQGQISPDTLPKWEKK